jgi:hypothetical protein
MDEDSRENIMTLNEFLDEFLDPKFQEILKLVEKVLESNSRRIGNDC